jgi:hypothetical protein
MGNSLSFQKEHEKLGAIVQKVLNDNDLFKNKHYNFLSEDVCNKYYMVFERDLEKHIKLDVANLSVYLFPKEQVAQKQDICSKISKHYVRILYVLCLIKYIYDLEHAGENSFASIIFQNIQIVDGIIRIRTCELPQKDYSNNMQKIDFKQLKGFDFFVTYFLNKDEARHFAGVMRGVLGREGKTQMAKRFCMKKELRGLYKERFGESLACEGEPGASSSQNAPDTHFFVEKYNPIFSGYFCGSPISINVKLSSTEGKKIKSLYEVLKKHYQANLAAVHDILNEIVQDDHLQDLSKSQLDTIISKVKETVQMFYVQTLVDYQNLIDVALKVPSAMRLE